MITQDNLERERYEARRKSQLDYNTGKYAARMEGEALGLEKGKKIGVILNCKELLQLPETPIGELRQLSLEDLTRLADDRQSQVMNQK